MRFRSSLRLRWIWGTVYAIAGALALVHLLFAWLDKLPEGVFYAGYGIASFIGALLAARQSRGSTLAEGATAGLLIGLLHMAFVLVQLPFEEAALHQVSVPLSSTFVCVAAAVAGSRLGARWNAGSPGPGMEGWRLTAMAVFVLIGASATHIVLFIVAAHLLDPQIGSMTAFSGFVVGLVTPSLAGAALQLTTSRRAEHACARAVALLVSSTLAILLIQIGGEDASLMLMFAFTLVLFLFAMVYFVLILPGTTIVRGRESWTQELEQPQVPTAVIRS